jgi:hypothetical protein
MGSQKTGKGTIKQVQFGSFERPLPHLLSISADGTP